MKHFTCPICNEEREFSCNHLTHSNYAISYSNYDGLITEVWRYDDNDRLLDIPLKFDGLVWLDQERINKLIMLK